ncbi:hypothetical protein DFH08DRAFT_942419 [Mycena albidolilacea]|uniref:Uncharacterized protein n=1 Tax=Mycena albidolilacea TaxID=1033008 RepID=A0AAD7EF12_9AGAR|nr:hypothetical protein DFH08DRAFT_942419 [Mycena albidolilacea]
MKLEPPHSQIPSESLQAKEDALRLKLKVIQLELQVIELDRQNNRLKKKRAADAVRIAALEAQIQGYPNALGVTKREDPQRHVLTPDTDIVNEDDMPESPKEPILVNSTLESLGFGITEDDEGPENYGIGAEESALNDLGRAPESPLSATPAQPSAERTSREAPSPVLPDRIPHERDSKSVEIQPEMNLNKPVPEVVVTKPEKKKKKVTKPELDDQFTRVTLFKSEDADGALDISNIGGIFGLGPPLEVDGKYNQGFARTVIADAFGGVRAGYFHNFGDPKPGQAATIPFFTLPRSWNTALPACPGQHGLGLFALDGAPVAPRLVNLFVGEGTTWIPLPLSLRDIQGDIPVPDSTRTCRKQSKLPNWNNIHTFIFDPRHQARAPSRTARRRDGSQNGRHI